MRSELRVVHMVFCIYCGLDWHHKTSDTIVCIFAGHTACGCQRQSVSSYYRQQVRFDVLTCSLFLLMLFWGTQCMDLSPIPVISVSMVYCPSPRACVHDACDLPSIELSPSRCCTADCEIVPSMHARCQRRELFTPNALTPWPEQCAVATHTSLQSQEALDYFVSSNPIQPHTYQRPTEASKHE